MYNKLIKHELTLQEQVETLFEQPAICASYKVMQLILTRRKPCFVKTISLLSTIFRDDK